MLLLFVFAFWVARLGAFGWEDMFPINPGFSTYTAGIIRVYQVVDSMRTLKERILGGGNLKRTSISFGRTS